MSGAIRDDGVYVGRDVGCVVLTCGRSGMPSALLDGLRRRGVVVRPASELGDAMTLLKGLATSGRILVVVEPDQIDGCDGFVQTAVEVLPGLQVWRYGEGEDTPLEPYTVRAQDAVCDPEPSVDDRVGGIPSGWYEGVPITMDEMATLLGEKVGQGHLGSGLEIGDSELVERLLSDVVHGFSETALALAVKRTGISDLRLVKAHEETATAWVNVAYGEHVFGRLGSDTANGSVLRPVADWLARWLELERRVEDITEIAHRDELTGLWNRRYFERALRLILDKAERRSLRVTLMIYDIDDFKAFNDEHGHAAGDEILKETAKLMRAVVRKQDVVARVGGDEFAVIFWDTEQPRKPNSRHPKDVRAVAERFQAAVHEHRFPKLGRDAPGYLTISAGLAGFPKDGKTVEELMAQADRMLLEGKSHGKNVLTYGNGARYDGVDFEQEEPSRV